MKINKEYIKRKLSEWLSDSFIYYKYIAPVDSFKEQVYKTIEEYYNKDNNACYANLYMLITQNRYNIIPLSYKEKIINTIISNVINENIN